MTAYHEDFTQWLTEQAAALRARRFEQLDVDIWLRKSMQQRERKSGEYAPVSNACLPICCDGSAGRTGAGRIGASSCCAGARAWGACSMIRRRCGRVCQK
jgi:Domain of unknown function DUF29